MMIRILTILFFFLASFVAFACEITDDAGNKIKLSQPAQRIISLAPDLTEILFVVGAGNHIVGVMQGSDYPAAAKKIPVIASYNSVDTERMLTLQPDLIVVWAEGNLGPSLKKFNIPIYYSHQKKLTDIPGTLQRLGCLAGTQKIADQAAKKFTQEYQALQKKYFNKKTVTVFYQVWQQPLITVTRASWINDVITLCGGKNIFANLKGASPQVNLEEVIVANPDVIVGTKSKQDWQRFWLQWPQVRAVKKHNIFALDPNLIERASPRLLQGAITMCEAFDSARGSVILP
ncbi:MAG: cobalamin-binding protein [Gammaproteobacteria bacterium]